MDNYFKKIRAIIADKSGQEPQDVAEDSFLMDDLNIGELELEEIFSALEDEYHVEFEEEEKEEIETVQDLVDLVLEKAE